MLKTKKPPFLQEPFRVVPSCLLGSLLVQSVSALDLFFPGW